MRRFEVGKSQADIDSVLRSIVRDAYRHVPVYRRLMEAAAVSPEDVRSSRDLSRLPIVSKEDLYRPQSLDEVLHRRISPDRCVRVTTSGSSGLPFSIYMSKLEAHYRRLLLLFAWRRVTRLSFPCTVAELVPGAVYGSGFEVRRWSAIRVVRVYAGLPIPEQLRILERARPQLLTGGPTALELLAEALETTGTALRPRHVVTRGEILTPDARRKIGTALECHVSDFYSSEEIGCIAWECPEDPQRMHLNTDACVVEIVDDEGLPVPHGNEGNILVTNLFNRTMPFLRYELGDRAALLDVERIPCSCGARNPSLSPVSGRYDDFVHLPDGRRLSPRVVAVALISALSDRSSLQPPSQHSCRGFQVVQDTLDHVTVRIIPEQGVDVDFESLIPPVFRNLHPSLRCSVELVDALEYLPSGKLKKVIDRIPK
ncbi:MAG: AMP-binding protein [Candidatus Bipolaricaulia bacterium]